MQAQRYLILAANQRLYAASLEELAEIAECALGVRDPIELPRARCPRGWRRLSGPRRKFRRVEGGADWLTNVMAWDEWQQPSSSTPRFAVSSSVGRRA
jgi:hypothetical protein